MRLFVFFQFILASTVVGIGEFGIRVAVVVATILNTNVSITTPENRTTATVTAYQVVVPLGHKLLPHVQREEEGPALAVVYVRTISV